MEYNSSDGEEQDGKDQEEESEDKDEEDDGKPEGHEYWNRNRDTDDEVAELKAKGTENFSYKAIKDETQEIEYKRQADEQNDGGLMGGNTPDRYDNLDFYENQTK